MNPSPTSSLDQQFEAAVQQVNNLPGDAAPALMTDLYGLYKQATDGDHDMPNGAVAADEAVQPSGPAGLSQAQWDSWSKCKGMAPDEAKQQYVARATEAAGGQPTGGTASGGVATDARTGAPASGAAAGGLRGDLREGTTYGSEEQLKNE